MSHTPTPAPTIAPPLSAEEERKLRKNVAELAYRSVNFKEVIALLASLDEARKDSKRLHAALDGLYDLFQHPGEGANECFERIADEFYKDTGFLRPGKSEPMASAYSGKEEERQKIYNEWLGRRKETARAALAALSQKGSQ